MPAHEASCKHPTIALQFEEPDVVVIVLAGDHDLSGTENLRSSLAFTAGMRDVLVDLSECTLMDASVLGELMLARDALTERRAHLELIIPSEATAIRRVFERPDSTTVAPIHRSRSSALAACATRGGQSVDVSPRLGR